jgi:hypothetical protein
MNVVQAFLCHAKNNQFQFSRKPTEVAWQIKFDGDFAALRKSIDIPLQRGGQAGLIEQRRMADDGPYLRPTFGAALAESAGVFVGANAGAITVVVKLNEIGPPPQEHGMLGAQHHVDGGDQKGRVDRQRRGYLCGDWFLREEIKEEESRLRWSRC